MRRRVAFSLTELVIVVAILGVLAVVTVPRLQLGALHRRQAEVAAAKMAADLRLTRRLAVANAATNNRGFELNMTGGAPYGGYEIANRDTHEVIASHAIDSRVCCTGTSKFKFGPLGTLDEDQAQLTFSADGKTVVVSVVRATGMVKCR
ncbi:MAG: type II secretion system protein [Sedimentisphaerales bacterium]|nr:type II secretion system protein [Sedimentisphaerales bacterium]